MALEQIKQDIQMKKIKKPMRVISIASAILMLYNKAVTDQLIFGQDEEIDVIIDKCQHVGNFFFRKEDSSMWYFIKTINNKQKPSIRMIFLLPDSEEKKGEERKNVKIHCVEKITELISALEKNLISIDNNRVYRKNSYSVLDVIKKIEV
jgi:hypothetical protein